MNYIFAGYWIALNLILFVAMGMDKLRAKRRERRIPERHLFILAGLGGALGGIIAMKVWRHKTKHAVFVFGFPFLLIVNALCAFYFIG